MAKPSHIDRDSVPPRAASALSAPLLSRRALVGGMSVAALSSSAAGRALLAWSRECGPDGVRVKYARSLPGGRVKCGVCPLDCELSEGETCFCRTRTNRGGVLWTDAFANPCIVRVDAIEKMPLAHVTPGGRTLSLGVGGCNVRCLYCQNWKQSQARPRELQNRKLSPGQVVTSLAGRPVQTIAYTYTEPVAFLEYVHDVAAATREKGIRNVVATAGFVREKPLADLCKVVDAFSFSLKGFDDAFYRKVVGCGLPPILKALDVIKNSGTWLEVVTLLVPTLNDDDKSVRALARHVARNLGPDVPLHFSRFVPEYRLKNLPPTPIKTMERARSLALSEGVRYCYLSNVAPHAGNDTYCPGCKKAIVKRLGFKILGNHLKTGACGFCGHAIPGIHL